MKGIELLHEGLDYILVSYKDDDGELREVEITGAETIEIVKTLGRALQKQSFLKNQ